MSGCTAPVQGHRTASGAANCPACGRGSYYSYRPTYPAPTNYATSRNWGNSGGSRSSASGSVGSSRPRWSPNTSPVNYTRTEVKALTPIREAIEARGALTDLRDVFLCHAWDDRRGPAKELHDFLEVKDVTVWFSEKDVLLGMPLMREIDKGLAKSRSGIVLVTPSFLKKLDEAGIADKELSALLAGELLVPVVHGTSYEELREVSPLLASRSGLSTMENTMEEIAVKISELVSTDAF